MTEKAQSYTYKLAGVELKVTPRYVETVQGFPFGQDSLPHNHFRIRVKSSRTEIARTFSFYGSAADQEQGRKTLNKKETLWALDCLIGDAVSGLLDLNQFGAEMGFPGDCLKAIRIYNGAKRATAKLRDLGIEGDLLYEVSNAIRDQAEASTRPAKKAKPGASGTGFSRISVSPVRFSLSS